MAAADISTDAFDLNKRLRGRPVAADAIVVGDLASAQQCADMIGDAERQLGRITLLINNATAQRKLQPFATLSSAACQHFVNTDLLAPIFLAQAALPSLSASKGHIINVSSVRVNSIQRGGLLYSTVKGAVETMTRAMAVEFAEYGVRANAVRVGAIAGDSFLRPVLATLPGTMAKRLRGTVMAQRLRYLNRDSISKTVGAPEDIAAIVAFLASTGASFVNGAVWSADGAYTLLHSTSGQSNGQSHDPVHARWTKDPQGELKRWLKTQR